MNKSVIMALVIGLVIGVLVMYGYATMTGYMVFESGKDLPYMAHQAKMINAVRQALVWDAGTIIDSGDRIVIIQGAVLDPQMRLEGKEVLYVGVFNPLALGEDELLNAVKTEQLNVVIREQLLKQNVLAEVESVDMLELRTTDEILSTHRGIMPAGEAGEWKMLVDNLEASMLAVRDSQGLQTSDVAWIISGRTTVGPIGDYMIHAERMGAGVLVNNILNIPLTEVLMDNLAAILGPSEVLSMPLSEVLASITASPTTFGLPSGGDDLY